MALVYRTICCLKPRVFPRILAQRYSYALTKLDFEKEKLSQSPSVNRLPYNTHQYTISIPIKPFSTHKKEDQEHNNEKVQKLSIFKRFKQMYRDYWYVLVPVHVVTSAIWFGGFYYLASSGFDIPGLLENMNFNEKIVNSMRNSSMGYFAISYALYKIATPARYAITLGGTTVSIQYLKKWGYIKPIPSKERLKELYTETKEGIKERGENLMESVHNLKDSVKETKNVIKEKKKIINSGQDSKINIKRNGVVSAHKKDSK